MVAYYIGEPMGSGGSSSAMMLYGSFWCFVSMGLLIVAMLFVPNYAKWRQRPAAILAAEQHHETMKTISLGRVLFGTGGVVLVVCLSLVKQTQAQKQEFPIQAPLTAFSVCLMLIFFLLDANVKRFLKDKLTARYQNWPKQFHFCRSSAVNPI
jgi:uncharacterized protein YacL